MRRQKELGLQKPKEIMVIEFLIEGRIYKPSIYQSYSYFRLGAEKTNAENTLMMEIVWDSDEIASTNMEIKVETSPLTALSGTTSCKTDNDYMCTINPIIKASGTYTFIATIEGTAVATSEEFTVTTNQILTSIKLSSPVVEKYTYFSIDITVDLLDENDSAYDGSCLVTLSEISGSEISGYNSNLIKKSGSIIVYFRIEGQKVIQGACGSIIATLPTKILKSILIMDFNPPKFIYEPFNIRIGIYNYHGGTVETNNGPYQIKLDLKSGSQVLQYFIIETVSGFAGLEEVSFNSGGTFTFSASFYGLSNVESSEFEVSKESVVVKLSGPTNSPSAYFDFIITVDVFRMDNQNTEPINIGLTADMDFLNGELQKNVLGASDIFTVFSTQAGSLNIKAYYYINGVYKESKPITVLILSQALKIDPIEPQVMFIQFISNEDEFDMTISVCDFSKSEVEILRGSYQISLVLIPEASTQGTWSGTTSYGVIKFTNLKIISKGTYNIKVNTDTGLSATSGLITVSIPQPYIIAKSSKATVESYENFDLSIEIYDSHHKLLVPSADVIILEKNSQKFNGPEKVTVINGKASVTLQFPESGNKIVQVYYGKINAEVKIVVEGLLNPDLKCKKSVSSTTCIDCVPGAILFQGVCSCSENSEFSSDVRECLCSDGYKRVDDYCIKECGKFYSASDIVGKFSDDFLTIYMTFSAEPVTKSNCKDFLLLPSSLEKANFYCNWDNMLTLAIHFKEFPQVKDLVIGIDPFKLQKTSLECKFNVEKLDIKITYSKELPSPLASINAPDIVSLKCSTSDLHISTLNQGRDYAYKWSSIYSPANKAVTDLFSTLKGTSIRIPLNQLSKGTLLITLKISSKSFKTQSTITKSIEIVSDPHLTVGLSSGSMISIKKSSNLSIKPIIKESCGKSSYNYAWTYVTQDVDLDFSEILSASANSNNLLINKNLLEAGNSYEFSISVTDGEAYGSASVTVVVEESPLVIYLSRSSGNIGNDEDFTMYSTVTDPDSETSNITYKWTCSEKNSECLDSEGKSILTTNDEYFITVPKSKLTDGALYVFSLEGSTSLKTKSISVEIEVEAGLKGQVYLERSQIKINTDYDIAVIPKITGVNPQSVTWKVLTGGTVIEGRGFTFLMVPAYTLMIGAEYELQLTLSESGLELTSVFYFLTNSPAVCESLNYEIVTSKKINLIGENCVDGDDSDYPLTYQFGVDLDETILWACSGLSSNEYTFIVNPSAAKGYLRVCDSLSSCTKISASISTASRSLDDISDSFEADTADLESIPSAIVYYSTIATADTVEKMTEKLIEYINGSIIDSSELDIIITSSYSLFNSKTSVTATQANTVLNLLINKLENIDFDLTDSQVESIYSVADRQVYIITVKNMRRLINAVRSHWINSKLPYSEVTFSSNLFVAHTRGLQSDYKNLMISGWDLNLTFPEQFLSDTENVIDFSFAKYYDENQPIFELRVFFSGQYTNHTLTLRSPEDYIGEFPDSLRIDYESSEFGSDSLCKSVDYMNWNKVSCKVQSLSKSGIQLELSQSSIFTLTELDDSSSLPSKYRSVIYILLIVGIGILIFAHFCDQGRAIKRNKKNLHLLHPLTSIFIPQSKPWRLLQGLHIVTSQSLLLLLIGGYYVFLSDSDEFEVKNVSKSGICLLLSQVYSLPSLIFIFFAVKNRKFEYVVYIFSSIVLVFSYICVIIITFERPSSVIFNWIFGFLLWSPIDLILIQFIYTMVLGIVIQIKFRSFDGYCESNPTKPDYTSVTKIRNLSLDPDIYSMRVNDSEHASLGLRHDSNAILSGNRLNENLPLNNLEGNNIDSEAMSHSDINREKQEISKRELYEKEASYRAINQEKDFEVQVLE